MKKLGSLFFYLEQERGNKGAKRCSSRVLLNNCFYVDEGEGVIKDYYKNGQNLVVVFYGWFLSEINFNSVYPCALVYSIPKASKLFHCS